MTFDEWFDKVNAVCLRLTGLTAEDFPDKCWYDWYESGMSPSDAARELLEEEGWGDALGF